MSTATDGAIDFTMMYATHNAFRRDIGRLIEMADTGSTSSAQHEGWNNFKAQLLLHHSVEDATLWPRLRLAVANRPADLALVDAMESEHGQIDPVLAAVDAALDEHSHALSAAAKELKRALGNHLEHEEDEALPLIQSVLAPADWAAFAGEMRRHQGLKGAAVYIPWVVDGTPPAEQRDFFAALPAPVRVVNKMLWERRYQRNIGKTWALPRVSSTNLSGGAAAKEGPGRPGHPQRLKFM
jgi:iron-sulfur cluster repair protein YtfE (RIC family)